MLLGKQNLFLD